MSQLAFDEDAGRKLEALYRGADAVRRRRLARAALRVGPGQRLLDVGCGPGFGCAELLDAVGAGGAVTGVDSSEHMLALAADRCAKHKNVNLLSGDATGLPTGDGIFDGALCVQVLEYVADVAAGLAELHRVLRPGGRVVVWDIDWSTVSWHSAEPARMKRVLDAWDEHLAHPNLPRILAGAMRRAGFEDVEVRAHEFAAAGRFDPDTYGAGITALIAGFAAGRGGITADEAHAWEAEQHELGRRGDYFFSVTQFCFSAACR